MGFMYNYKRLEKLCSDLFDCDHGISTYIDEMLKKPRRASLVTGWNDDLKNLKHYRWLRNRIVHEPQYCEDEMCDSTDVEWIMNFHARIINQEDPLALYRKAIQPRQMPETKKPDEQFSSAKSQDTYYEHEVSGNYFRFRNTVFIIIFFLLFSVLFFLFLIIMAK
ncbi:MAG TPA: hypothetical protein PLI19_02165 [Erysipelotrichaceae bacterium]|nr:hypothetical protein [Erysipelotrichaceae bacterium]